MSWFPFKAIGNVNHSNFNKDRSHIVIKLGANEREINREKNIYKSGYEGRSKTGWWPKGVVRPRGVLVKMELWIDLYKKSKK